MLSDAGSTFNTRILVQLESKQWLHYWSRSPILLLRCNFLLCPRGKTLAGLRKMMKAEKSKGLSGVSFVIHRSIPEILDLQVSSFLFGQVIKGSHIKFPGSVLSNDRKFMAAVKRTGEDFNECYDKLVDLGKLDN
jgi:hypothetical protein